MAEWASYGVSDFLMYSPRVWWRLVERYNQAAWPWHLVGTAAALALLACGLRGGRTAERTGFGLLALAWATVAGVFHWRWHSEISIAAGVFATGAGITACSLAACAGLLPSATNRGHVAHRRVGLGLALVFAACAYPLTALAGSARTVTHAEVFGLMPDPTALATVGFVLASRSLRAWWRALLCALPLLALAWSAAMRWAMAAQ
jgi:hypothetical protein